MIVGFSGPAATGKSWAAKELAAQLRFEYVPSKAAEVAASIGFDVNQPHSFEQRLSYQRSVLKQMIIDLTGSAFKNMVFDRTPLDLMAYSIMANGTDSLNTELDDYLAQCKSVLAIHFDVVAMVSPPLKELVGLGEHKEGRFTTDAIYGSDHRLVFDKTLKTLCIPKEVNNKLLIIPEDLHYQDRVEFVKERINAYNKKPFT